MKAKHVDALFVSFKLYSMFLFWFLFLTAVYLSDYIFSFYDFVAGFSGILGLLLPALTPMLIMSSVSVMYRFLQTSPISVKGIVDIYFWEFELMVVPASVFCFAVFILTGDGIELAFALQKFALILNLGHISLFMMSSGEMKLGHKKFLLPFIIAYIVSFGYLIIMKGWEESLREDSSGLYLNFILTGVLVIAGLILRPIMKKKALKRIFA